MKKTLNNSKTILLSGKSQPVALSQVGEATINSRSFKAAFDKWFVENYSKLKEHISIAGAIDNDAFHEAYLSIATNKKLSSKDADFRKLFLSTYRIISRRAINECYVVCHPEEVFFSLLPETEETEEVEEKDNSKLANMISSFILNTFTKTQQSVFKMRLQGFSIKDTADSLDLNDRQVKESINEVVHRTRTQFAFSI